MVFLSGLRSIIEASYLDLPLVERFRETSILVNPDKPTYITGKTIIINDPRYSLDYIKTLLSNSCKLISRIQGIFEIEHDNFDISPYLPRLCDKIMWNGDYIRSTLTEDNCNLVDFSYSDGILYYPKPLDLDSHIDSSLSYLAYQLGINIYPDTPFLDLDIIKTKKIFL